MLNASLAQWTETGYGAAPALVRLHLRHDGAVYRLESSGPGDAGLMLHPNGTLVLDTVPTGGKRLALSESTDRILIY